MSVTGPDALRPPEEQIPVPPRRGRFTRPILYAASLAAIVWAAFVTPLPYVELVPGAPTAIPPLIEVSGTPTTPIQGETTLLTIFIEDVTPVRWLGAQLDGNRLLRDLSEIVPGGDLTEDFFAQERQRFAQQFQVATAVGAEAAGVGDVTLRTAVLVSNVLAEGPAAGVLRPGDRIVTYDGAPITTGQELQALTRAAAPGEPVTLTVAHGDDQREVEVTPDVIPGTDTVALGVQVETVADGLELPFEVELGDTRIGGPSAGMMIALTVYDLLAEEDLVAGRTIAGTGTIDAEGRIGPVGGVAEKMVAAADHGAELVLVPSAQLEQALSTAPEGLRVIPVDTFDQALAALRPGADEG